MQQEHQERVLFVHAHPDDESISTGGTIAALVAGGAHVSIVTCTRGERGEVIPQHLRQLATNPDDLAAHRETELAAALDLLGVKDHRYLGAVNARWPGKDPRRYTDSGMQWGSDGAEATRDASADSLTRAPFSEVAADIAAVIAEVTPHAVVSYNEWGGYGHPDHIRVHQAARRASDVMGVAFFAIEPDDSAATATMVVDTSAHVGLKRRALAAHATQLTVSGESFTLSNGDTAPIGATESFRRIRPVVEHSDAFRALGRVTQAATVILVALIGAIAGFLLTAIHQWSVELAGVSVPAGLIVGLLAAVALISGLRIVWDTRVLPAVGGGFLLAATALLAFPTSGGSVVVPANLAGYAWSFGPAVVTLFVLAWPRVQRSVAGKIGVVPAVKGSPIS
ncbi:MAG: PIG-L family deacetylase [Microbacteriaceae bacterium]